jgi:hypothetical protein
MPEDDDIMYSFFAKSTCVIADKRSVSLIIYYKLSIINMQDDIQLNDEQIFSQKHAFPHLKTKTSITLITNKCMPGMLPILLEACTLIVIFTCLEQYS